MSHSKERHEKICLNCNAELNGRYCHMCGQENIEPKETVWSLVSHFFYDITHFDGKFFSTTKLLIIRPGFLPKEYIEGRRARYLHPIRMYVFSSALFFLCLYSVFHFHGGEEGEDKKDKKTEFITSLPDSVKAKALSDAKDKEDSMVVERALDLARPYMRTPEEKKDTTAYYSKKIGKTKNNFFMVDPHLEYTSIKEYDSIQNTLPAAEKDSWFRRHRNHRQIELNARYKGDQKAMWRDLLEKFVHTFPYLLFISLPLYAFYLKLLYIRRKQFLYVTHGIFLIYLYIFTFINLLVYFGLNKIHESMDWDWVGWIEAAVLLYGVWYAYKAMRKFYGQGRGKTLLKFFILNTFAFFSIIFLFVGFFLFAVFKF
ncbi:MULTISPECIES: DUF3667 domain-containing protein [Niastella]|uniref:DUF3667 domain-containing protein n=1 Tax=Niastella soli TaxID=2821487 RepID=A0ABS3Z3Y3_9BACT|nr:DUF3667 domain-containing protein [Niastella soli]MBO9204874.1 DUF3667 domain-containing protein [Niastella soli]